MEALEARLQPWAPYIRSLLRIMAALLLLGFGLWKLFDFPSAPNFEITPIYYAAGIIELIGGTLLTLGLFTRPVAFFLSGETAVAYFYDHAPSSFYPVENDGGLPIMFSFVCLYFFFAGGGPLSLDRLVLKRE
jgi:putative oxidoreductase